MLREEKSSKDGDLIFVTELDGVFNNKLQEKVEWYWKKCSAWGVALEKKIVP